SFTAVGPDLMRHVVGRPVGLSRSGVECHGVAEAVHPQGVGGTGGSGWAARHDDDSVALGVVPELEKFGLDLADHVVGVVDPGHEVDLYAPCEGELALCGVLRGEGDQWDG